MSDMPVFQLENIEKTFLSGDESLKVLAGVSLSLSAGELVALVAPSGTGKSTLLHIAGLLEKAESGRVIINGRDVSSLADAGRSAVRRNEIGFVYQFHHLLAEFTALENVLLPQRIAGRRVRGATQHATALLSQFGLGSRMSHLPGRLSGGEKQRVAIARALANQPKIILADEPTGNLDVRTSDLVFDNLLDVVRNTGTSALIATHNEALARRMHRIVSLRDGRLYE